MTTSHELEKFFSSLGLDEASQNVYFALLGLADAPVSLIAKKAGVKRPTAYNILENLVKSGLASSYISNKIKRYTAENPIHIKSMLEDRIVTFEKLKPELDKYQHANISRTKAPLNLYEGEEGIRTIYNKLLESKEKVLYSIGSSQKIKEVLGPDFSFSRRRVAQKILSKSLRVREEEIEHKYITQQKERLRELRFLPAGMKITSTILILDNTVAVISPKEEDFGFTVVSKSLAESLKSLFHTLWNVSEPAK
ncbi:MAG: helix-turn-helix domain-containing protein [Patescibacteria group bacterium]